METSTTFQPQIIKITLTPTGDTRRIQLIEPPSYEELLTRIHSLFGINTSERLQLTYVDDEGDTITIANGDDVQMSLIAQAPGKSLRINVSPKPSRKEYRSQTRSQRQTPQSEPRWRRPHGHFHHQHPHCCRNHRQDPWGMMFGNLWDPNAMREQLGRLFEGIQYFCGNNGCGWFTDDSSESSESESPGCASCHSQHRPSQPRSEQSHQQQYSPPKTDEPKEEKPKEEPRVVPPQPEQEARAPPQNPFNFGQNMDWSGMMQQFAPLVQQFGPMLQNFVQGMNSTGQHPNPSQFPQSPHQSAPKKDDEEDDIY